MELSNLNQLVRSVWMVLKITFFAVPVIAGLDKFTNLLVDWDRYLHPGLASMLPFSAHTFMQIAGVIEIIAGILVLVKPSVGGWLVMAWLLSIALTLLISGNYPDVAVRDIVLSVGAMSLARLSKLF